MELTGCVEEFGVPTGILPVLPADVGLIDQRDHLAPAGVVVDGLHV